ncbi:MAG: hypothetical protein KKA05_10590 [Alphaproteobacteria bacterium]|nr:hypothetical protein [Alphaproteobacteria bacterium]
MRPLPPFSPDAVKIALRTIRCGGRVFIPADHFPWTEMNLSEAQVTRFEHQKMVGNLTRHSYEGAMRARPADADRIGRGFTEAALIRLGIIDDPATAPATATAPVGDAEFPEGVFKFEHAGETVFLLEHPNGRFKRYDVFDDKARRINPGGTVNGMAGVKKLLDKFSDERAKFNGASPLDFDHDGNKKAGGSAPEPVAQPDWSAFDTDPAKWTPVQTAVFETWFDELPEDDTPILIEHAGIRVAFTQRLESLKPAVTEQEQADITAQGTGPSTEPSTGEGDQATSVETDGGKDGSDVRSSTDPSEGSDPSTAG